jgi:hypothetical protein
VGVATSTGGNYTVNNPSGVFKTKSGPVTNATYVSAGTNISVIDFNADYVVPVGPENSPASTSSVFCVTY